MKKKVKLYIVLAILGVILVVGGTSYALLTLLLEGNTSNSVQVGTLSLDLTEGNAISLTSVVPITDEEGMNGNAFNFSVTNDGTLPAGYKIFLANTELEVGENRLLDSDIRYELKVDGVQDTLSNLSENVTELYISNIEPGVVVDFELRIWIDYDVTSILPNSVHRSMIRIEASQNKNVIMATGDPNDTSGANVPELVGEMIPVVYDGTNWVKAGKGNWYNYDNQEWANAVTVTETNRATLVSSAAGTVIPMDDINAMFVWIPRYSYTIGNTYGYQGYGGSTPSVDTPGAFNIKFISSETTEFGTAVYSGNEAVNWYTNPAFCWGNSCDDALTRSNAENRELSGIWVGKFETSTTGGVETNSVQQPIIKPSVNSWRNVTVSNMFNSVKTYMNSDNGSTIFGLSGSTYDTHMMKNTEWGAVAYLSQSKYGKYGNTIYTGANKEVAINNCSSYVTGIGGDTVSAGSSSSTCTTNTYETEKGQASSTTGNVYGIFDMSGGAFEYVMGNMEDASGNFYPLFSGFSNEPEARYYNSYANDSSDSDYTRGILGDGTKETAGFYNDYKNFVNGSSPWFFRGGNLYIISNAGVFYFGDYDGYSYSNIAFRVSLVP